MTTKKTVSICLEPIVIQFTPIHSPQVSPLLNPINIPSLTAYLSLLDHDLSESVLPHDLYTPEQSPPTPEQSPPSPLNISLSPLTYSPITMELLTPQHPDFYLDSSVSLSTIPEVDEINCETPVQTDKSQSVD